MAAGRTGPWWWLTAVLGLIWAAAASAGVTPPPEIRLDPAVRSVEIDDRFAMLRDETHALTLAGAKASPGWQAGTTNLGYTSDAYWVWLRLRNDGSHDLMRRVVLQHVVPVEADFYVTTTDGAELLHTSEGMASPTRNATFLGLRSGVNVTVPKGSARDVYLRIRHTGLDDVMMAVVDENGFDALNNEWLMLLSGYLGIVLCLLAHSFAMYLSVRDVCYLYYMGAAALFGLSVSNSRGYFSMLPYRSRLALLPLQTPSLTVAAIGVATLFARQFLDMRELYPRFDRALRLGGYAILATALVTWTWPAASGAALLAVVPLFAVCTLCAAIACVRKGRRYAWYYIAAYAMPVITGVLYACETIAGTSSDIGEAVVVCFAVELVTMAAGLSERVATMRRGLLAALRDRETTLVQALARETEAHEEASRLNRMRDQFLATLSHELRTPLAAIIGWLEILETAQGDVAERQRARDVIERNARHQLRLVEDLLDVSRAATGKLQLQLEPTDVCEVTRDAIDALRGAADARDLRVETSYCHEEAVVHGDRDRLKQVIWNLVANAVKFSNVGGRVDVRVDREGDWVVVRVHDEGIGISPDFLPHAFQRFSQADPSLSRKYGGLGLGLALCRHIVELHGGTTEAASAGLGKGATFTVRIRALGR